MSMDILQEINDGVTTYSDITFINHKTAKNNIKNPVSNNVSKYLNGLYKLKQDIINSDNPDKFLAEYTNDQCLSCKNNKSNTCDIMQNFIPAKDAIDRMYTFQNGLFGKIIEKLSESNIDILVAGSTGLAAVLRRKGNSNRYKFEPKDMDIYVKNITDEKIRKIDMKIRELFSKDKYNIYIVRRPITITWWIFDKDDVFVTEIQLNILQIRTFAEPFIVHHSDIVAIGYDIKNQQFIVLEQRWNNFVSKFPNAYMTNLNSYDNKSKLISAVNKYNARGFTIKSLIVYNDINDKFQPDNSNMHISDDSSGNKLIDKFTSSYNSCPDIIISDNIDLMYDPTQQFPSLIEIRNINEKHEFVKYVLDFEYPNGYECFVNYEKHQYVVANVNCMHNISFKAFILMGSKFRQCPICRAHFNPVVYKITDDRKEAIKSFQNRNTKLKSHYLCKDNYFTVSLNDIKRNKKASKNADVDLFATDSEPEIDSELEQESKKRNNSIKDYNDYDFNIEPRMSSRATRATQAIQAPRAFPAPVSIKTIKTTKTTSVKSESESESESEAESESESEVESISKYKIKHVIQNELESESEDDEDQMMARALEESLKDNYKKVISDNSPYGKVKSVWEQEVKSVWEQAAEYSSLVDNNYWTGVDNNNNYWLEIAKENTKGRLSDDMTYSCENKMVQHPAIDESATIKTTKTTKTTNDSIYLIKEDNNQMINFQLKELQNEICKMTDEKTDIRKFMTLTSMLFQESVRAANDVNIKLAEEQEPSSEIPISVANSVLNQIDETE